MKRFHVHVSVQDLGHSVRFYSALFGAEPAVVKADYAKWMLDDPAVNFAISARGAALGVNHLGLQFDSDEDLEAIESRLDATGVIGVPERDAACCYARSDKYWTVDPAGIAWEQFHTTGEIAVFGEELGRAEKRADGCCTPAVNTVAMVNAGCCGDSGAKSNCC